jgi:SAM-dependent methyltransferase
MGFLAQNRTNPTPAPGLDVTWEETNCLLCGCPRWSHVVEAPDNLAGAGGLWFAVVRCADCGLCYTNPRPGPDCMDRFYPADYRPRRLRRPPSGPGGARPLRRWRPPRGDRRILDGHGENRLLDFGCGSGRFLEYMDRKGWQVMGLDVSAPAVQRIHKESGLRALAGTLPHPALVPDSFDVITMWHSLEHVPYPRDVLENAYFLLAPGGKLLVAVPNMKGLGFRWFGPAWYGLDLPRHLTHFTPPTLCRMLERAGFRVGPVRMVGQGGWLRYSARLACRRLDRRPWHRWLQGRMASRLAGGFSYLSGRADSIFVTATRES